MAESMESKRFDKMLETLDSLNNRELMQLYRDGNSWDGSYEFVDGWDMDEFLTIMIDGKKGSELRDFILDVAQAVNNYNGSDGIEDAMWGYPNGYDLEIRDESDIIEEAREDYLEDLAQDIIDEGSYSKKFDYPGEVEDLFSQWDNEDECGWLGAGDYVAYNQNGDEVEKKHFSDFDDYYEWTENNELWSFDCVETDA